MPRNVPADSLTDVSSLPDAAAITPADQPGTPQQPGLAWVPSRWVIPTVLGVLSMLIALARVHTYHEPLERDLTSYAVYAHELLHGRQLYSDIWDHKPPGQFATYAVAELIAGYGPSEIYFLNIALGIAAMLGAYATGKTVGGRMAGLAAAAIWAVAAGSLPLEGNQPNTELGINAWTIWGVYFLWKDSGKGRWLGQAIAAGLLFALASLYKHQVVITPILLALALLINPPARQYARVVKRIAIIGATGVMVWTVVFAYFAATGRFEIFFNSLFRENTSYAGSLFDNLLLGTYWHTLAPWPVARAMFPPAIAAIVAAIIRIVWRGTVADVPGSADRKPRPAVSLHALAWVLATWLAVELPGRFYPHYYQLWLPAVCIGGGWGIAEIATLLARMGNRFNAAAGWTLATLPVLLVLGSILAMEAPTYALSPEQWSIQKYTPIFVAEHQLSGTVDAMLAPDETLYNFGNEMGFYFYTRRKPPVGMMSSYLLRGFPMSDHFNEQVLQQLSAHPPELVIITMDEHGPWIQTNPVYSWLVAHYRMLPTQPDNGLFTLICLKGGKLEKRLGLKPE